MTRKKKSGKSTTPGAGEQAPAATEQAPAGTEQAPAGHAAATAPTPSDDEAAGQALRQKYEDRCQVCGHALLVYHGRTHAELFDLDPPEAEPAFDAGRTLVLCPNHRTLFALGALAVDPDARVLWSADSMSALAGRPLMVDRHTVSVVALRRAWERRIAVPAEPADARFRNPLEVLEAAFRAALTEDVDQALESYLRLVAGTEQMSPALRRGIRDFSWKHFRSTASLYLTEDDPRSFVVRAQTPAALTPADRKVRLLLSSDRRSDAPITLVRGDDGRWFIDFNGL